MRHLLEPTQIELRAWSNGLQALGPDTYKQLETPTTLGACINRALTPTTRGPRTVEPGSTRTATSPTRRGGSSTEGRETNHRPATPDRTVTAPRHGCTCTESDMPETVGHTAAPSDVLLRSASAPFPSGPSMPAPQGRQQAALDLGNTGFLCKANSNPRSEASA